MLNTNAKWDTNFPLPWDKQKFCSESLKSKLPMRGHQPECCLGRNQDFKGWACLEKYKARVGKPPLLTRGGPEGSRKIAFGNRLLTNGRTRLVNLHILLFMTQGLKELE